MQDDVGLGLELELDAGNPGPVLNLSRKSKLKCQKKISQTQIFRMVYGALKIMQRDTTTT